MDMQAPELGAAMQLRKHLPRVEQAVRVESTFQALLMRQISFAKHSPHEVSFLDPDAVLAGEHAADFDAEPQDIGSKGLGSFDLVRLVGVVKDERVKIAVARMEDVGDCASPYRTDSACVRLRTSASRARGIVPSMQ